MDQVNTEHVEMRAELRRRGLVLHGRSKELKERLEKDDTRGIFEGNLASMSDTYLREGCRLLSIPSTRKRQELIEDIRKYNEYKRQRRDNPPPKWSLNTGLPTPDDRLGKPTGEKILGTQGSPLYLKSYSRYLQEYKKNHKTTENALTLRYWRTNPQPRLSSAELWPIKRADSITGSSDDTDDEAK